MSMEAASQRLRMSSKAETKMKGTTAAGVGTFNGAQMPLKQDIIRD